MLGEFAAWEGRERPRHFTQQVRQVENAGELAKAGHWLAAQLKPGYDARRNPIQTREGEEVEET